MPSALTSALLVGMAARRSAERRFAWVLVLSAVAGACGHGGTSRPGGTSNATGGTPNGDGATGGTEAGGTDTAGTSSTGGATAGGAPSVCQVVSSLPVQGEACPTPGESQCLSSGERCLCERGIWYCNNACPDSQPTANTACSRGAACTYSNGDVGCACVNSLWMCIGVSDCPASQPTTGNACDGLSGIACDYPNSNPALHFACMCSAGADASSGATWICVQSARCPATQPAYAVNNVCPGIAVCTYASEPRHCACLQAQNAWICI